MFPTHTIYVDGKLQQQIDQAPVQTFIKQGNVPFTGTAYERTPDQIQ
jgi:hypothetical protein